MIATSYFALARIGVGMFTLLKVRPTFASACSLLCSVMRHSFATHSSIAVLHWRADHICFHTSSPTEPVKFHHDCR